MPITTTTTRADVDAFADLLIQARDLSLAGSQYVAVADSFGPDGDCVSAIVVADRRVRLDDLPGDVVGIPIQYHQGRVVR